MFYLALDVRSVVYHLVSDACYPFTHREQDEILMKAVIVNERAKQSILMLENNCLTACTNTKQLGKHESAVPLGRETEGRKDEFRSARHMSNNLHLGDVVAMMCGRIPQLAPTELHCTNQWWFPFPTPCLCKLSSS